MKKFLSGLILIGFLAILVAPLAASAAEIGLPGKCTIKRDLKVPNVDTPTALYTCGSGGSPAGTEDLEGKYSMCCVLNTMYNVTDAIFVVLVALAGIFVVIGALMLLMSAGDPQKTASGRQYIMWAAIGLIVGLLAKAIPSIVRMVGAI